MQEKFSISFALPMFNESENIERAINIIKNLAEEIASSYEIVIADDASTDESVRVVRRIQERDSRIKLHCLSKNTKFGGAFALAFKNATKDIIVYMDSDLPVSTEDIKKSIPLAKEYDIISGCSMVKKGDTIKRKIISGVYNVLVQSLFGLNVKDINSGYKIVKRKVVDEIEFISKSPFVDVELFLHAKKNGFKVTQYPLVFQTREGGKSYISRPAIIIATFCDMLKLKVLTIRNKK